MSECVRLRLWLRLFISTMNEKWTRRKKCISMIPITCLWITTHWDDAKCSTVKTSLTTHNKSLILRNSFL
jgi:hypothetical protein